MICEECKKQGLKSKVFDKGSSTTYVAYLPFYDEDGKEHHHDANTITTAYKCSNGHIWETKTTGSCWCGWPHREMGDEVDMQKRTRG